MRGVRAAAGVALVLVAAVAPAFALEKQARAFDEDRSDEWNAASSCLIRYYNICTGWLWTWGPWNDGDRLGMVVNSCLPPGINASLLQTGCLTYGGAPSGYGFTGTISIHNVDANDCPTGAAMYSQPFLPLNGQFVVHQWGAAPVGNRFVIMNTISDALAISNPALFATDHPAAGATGPQACGQCYPATRTSHSFFFGNESAPLCPGTKFNDGTCDAEFLWEMSLFGENVISIDATSWGSIKALYR